MLSDWLPFLIYALRGGHPRHRCRRRLVPLRHAPDIPDEPAPDHAFWNPASSGPPAQDRRFTVSFYLTAMLFILFDVESSTRSRSS